MDHSEIAKNLEVQSFSCFKDVFAEAASKFMTFGEIYKLIKHGGRIYPDHSTLSESTLRARQHLEAGDKAGYDRVKKQLPAITPHAFYPAGRGKESEHELTEVMMVDLDHLTDEELEKILEDSKNLQGVILACKSLSGKGAHLLMRCTPIPEGQFELCYKALCEYVECVLGKAPDPACKNINRLMIINHDPDVYYNPEALPFDFSWILWSNNSFNIF